MEFKEVCNCLECQWKEYNYTQIETMKKEARKILKSARLKRYSESMNYGGKYLG